MEERSVKAFEAITSFVKELWETLGVKGVVTPLALYNRLLEHITTGDKKAVGKCVTGFRQFLSTYHDKLLSDDVTAVPKNAKIVYGTSQAVYLEIGEYLRSADNDTRTVIRQHLLIISALLEPDKVKMKELEKKLTELNVDTSTPEGQFIGNLMGKAKNAMETVDAQNPATAIAGLLQSGLITDLVSGLQDGVSSGSMDVRRLLGTMQGAINSLMPPEAIASISSASIAPAAPVVPTRSTSAEIGEKTLPPK